MSMTAQQQVETGVCALTIDFGRVGEQNRERVIGNFGCGFLDVIDTIEVYVVDTGEVNLLAVTHNRHILVEQHSYPHAFEAGDHTDRVVIEPPLPAAVADLYRNQEVDPQGV